MLTLKIGNSYSQLFGLTVDQYYDLKDLMSYTVNTQGFGNRARFQRRCLLNKQLQFPSGLLYLVQNYLRNVSYDCQDTRVRPITPLEARESLFAPGVAPTPYPEQIAAQEALEASDGRGIVVGPTGVGKSLMIALTIDTFRVKTLVVVPKVELKRQLTESLVSWFGKANFDKFVQVANIDSLDPNKVLKDFGMVITDEFHHSAAKSYRDLNKKAWVNVYHRVGYTATPFRTDDEERLLLESFLAEEVYRIPYHTAVEKGYIVPLDTFYYTVPKKDIVGNPTSYPAMYSELIVNNSYRNDMICLVLGRLRAVRKATVCLVKEIAHGEKLSAITGIPFANGQDGRSQELINAFNSGRIKSLIGTYGVLGEGVDTKPAEYIVIAGAGKAKTQFMQGCGRSFRKYEGKESCKVILFNDTAHKWFKGHFREQCKVLLEEYGVAPTLMQI